jgi:predicted ferric reductase
LSESRTFNTKALFIFRELNNLDKFFIDMGNLLYIIAVILVIAWIIGFIGYSLGWLIHILLVIAVIAILLRIIRGKRSL